MPCRTDYMEPNEREIELSRVRALLRELNGDPLDLTELREAWAGKLPGVWMCPQPQEILDRETALLCSRLKTYEDVSCFSLELQMWWRDHQAADRRRELEEENAKKTEILKKQALAKLTREERLALGL